MPIHGSRRRLRRLVRRRAEAGAGRPRGGVGGAAPRRRRTGRQHALSRHRAGAPPPRDRPHLVCAAGLGEPGQSGLQARAAALRLRDARLQSRRAEDRQSATSARRRPSPSWARRAKACSAPTWCAATARLRDSVYFSIVRDEWPAVRDGSWPASARRTRRPRSSAMRQWTDRRLRRPSRSAATRPAWSSRWTPGRTARWMQALAAENNQAETAFLLRTGDPARFGLRWFTPAVEVPLCGHATLASATRSSPSWASTAPAVTFDTQSGPLTVTRAERWLPDGFPVRAAAPHRAAGRPRRGARREPLEVWAGAVSDRDRWPTRRAVRALDARPRGARDDRRRRRPDGRGNVGVSALAAPGAGLRRRQPLLRARLGHPGGSRPPASSTARWRRCSPRSSAAPRLRFHQAYPGRGGDLVCEVRGRAGADRRRGGDGRREPAAGRACRNPQAAAASASSGSPSTRLMAS